MVYTVELSFDARKHATINEFCYSQRLLASSYHCEIQYFMHEVLQCKNKITKNDCIHVVHFSDTMKRNFIDFIKEIYKKKMVFIECIYSGDNNYNFIYVSGRYLKRMNKMDAKDLKLKYKEKYNDDLVKKEILNIFKKE